jgi:hypothetical protein
MVMLKKVLFIAGVSAVVFFVLDKVKAQIYAKVYRA